MGNNLYGSVISHGHLFQYKQVEIEVAQSAFPSPPVVLHGSVLSLGLTPVLPGLIVSVSVPLMHRSLSSVDH